MFLQALNQMLLLLGAPDQLAPLQQFPGQRLQCGAGPFKADPQRRCFGLKLALLIQGAPGRIGKPALHARDQGVAPHGHGIGTDGGGRGVVEGEVPVPPGLVLLDHLIRPRHAEAHRRTAANKHHLNGLLVAFGPKQEIHNSV